MLKSKSMNSKMGYKQARECKQEMAYLEDTLECDYEENSDEFRARARAPSSPVAELEAKVSILSIFNKSFFVRFKNKLYPKIIKPRIIN